MKKKLKKNISNKIPILILATFVIAYSLILSLISIGLFNQFNFSAFDIGIMDQGIWLLSQGKNPFVTVRGVNLFGDHIQFILLLVTPFYWIWNDIRVLLVLQSIAVGLSAIPLYFLAKDKFKNYWLSLVFVLAYFLYPALHYQNLENFHAVTFAIPILLFAFYFLEKGKFTFYLLFMVLGLITKEEIALTFVFVGIYAFLKKEIKIGLITIISSVLWLIVAFNLIFPYYNEFGYFHSKYGAFGEFGKTPLEAIGNMLVDPKKVIEVALTSTNLNYLWELLSPIAFLSFLHPTTLFLALPAISINLLTGWPYAHSIKFHYTAAISPFIFISAIYGIAFLMKYFLKNKNSYKKLLTLVLSFALLFASLWANYTFGPELTSIKNYSRFFELLGNFNTYTEHHRTIYEAIRIIPTNASISATHLIVPHITHREIIYMFPNPFKQSYWGLMESGKVVPPYPTNDVDYIVADLNTVMAEDKKEILDKLLEKGSYTKILEKENVVVLKRI